MTDPNYKKPVLKAYGSLKEQTLAVRNGVGIRDSSKGNPNNKTG